MLGLLQSLGRLVNGLLDLIAALRAAHYRKKYQALQETVEQLEKKVSEGNITDDEIINAARELRERKKDILP